MEPREYRPHRAVIIFGGVMGVVCLAMSMPAFITGIGNPHIAAPMFFGGVSGLALSSFLIMTAVIRMGRPITRHGPTLQAILHTGTVTSLPQTTRTTAETQRVADELTAALREHVLPATGDTPSTTGEKSLRALLPGYQFPLAVGGAAETSRTFPGSSR